MSLILEALRKSEAERRRGQTPDLLSDVTPAAPAANAATRNASAKLAVAIAALVTLLLVAWWLRSGSNPEPESTVTTAEPVDSVSTTASTASSSSVPAQSQAPLRVPTAAASTTAPATALPPAPLSPPATTPPKPTPPVPATSTAPNTAPSSTIAEPIFAPLPPTEQVATAEPPPAFTSPDVPLRLADLSADERQQLPTLKVSMHMWASEVANRFAIIDGTRVNEGDRVGEATVEAIQQDGVLLSWRGRRIRLPIR
jgi:general secretion pathway protein B